MKIIEASPMLRALAVVLLLPTCVFAAPITWTTATVTSFWQEDGTSLTTYDSRFGTNYVLGSNSNTGVMSRSVNVDGATISYMGAAAAERGVLHSGSAYNIVGPIEDWGVSSQATWAEYGVKAVDIGQPDLLAGITAFKVTFNLDGTITGLGPYNSAIMAGSSCVGTTCRSGSAEVLGAGSNFLGSISFYMQPADTTGLFDMYITLGTLARSVYVAASGSSNYSNTATLASIIAVDANNNPIPGVELELGDGTYIGADGFSAAPVPTTNPEPASFVLLSTGVLGAFAAWRRRQPQTAI